jgi:hypothetical protein
MKQPELPKIAEVVIFIIQSQDARFDSSIATMASLFGSIEFTYSEGNLHFLFPAKFTPKIRRFKEYLTDQKINHQTA